MEDNTCIQLPSLRSLSPENPIKATYESDKITSGILQLALHWATLVYRFVSSYFNQPCTAARQPGRHSCIGRIPNEPSCLGNKRGKLSPDSPDATGVRKSSRRHKQCLSPNFHHSAHSDGNAALRVTLANAVRSRNTLYQNNAPQ